MRKMVIFFIIWQFFITQYVFVFGYETKEILIVYKAKTQSNTYKIGKITLPPETDTYTYINRLLNSRNDILYAEPVYPLRKQVIPNDPYFWDSGNIQWWWDTINAPSAWDLTTGLDTVYIAVLDTGVDYLHEDLTDNLWVNTGEFLNQDNNNNKIDDGCENGDDKDGNGYVDDCYGINALCYSYDENTGNYVFNNTLAGCNRPDAYDDDGHGTHVAGIIGAVSNNGIGVAGTNWNVKIIPCKFLDANGNGDTFGEVLCIDYIKKLKRDKGLNIVVVNASYGGSYPYSQIEVDRISSLENEGIIFVTAAGNTGDNNDLINFYPCNYELNNMLCVGASDNNNQRAVFTLGLSSNYGKEKVKVFAPGLNIYSTYLSTSSTSYAYYSGTSQATPFVSGALGLLEAYRPGLTITEKINRILYTGNNVPQNLSGYSYTCNVINLYNILTADTSQQKICFDKIRHNFGTVQTTASAIFTVRNTGLSDLTVSSITSDNDVFRINENCTGTVISTGNTCSFQVDFIPTQSTTYSGTITVYYGNGKSVNISVNGVGNINNSDGGGGGCSYGKSNISNFALLLILIGIFVLRKLKFS